MIARKLKSTTLVFTMFAVVIVTAKQLEKEDYTQFFENSNCHNQQTTKQLVATPITANKQLTSKKESLFPAAPNKDLAQKTDNKRTIKVINHMDDKKGLTYNHKTGKYKPKEFKLLVNDTENAYIKNKKDFIKQAVQNIEVKDDNIVCVEYYFKFSEYWGAYTRDGKRRVEIKVEDDADSIEIDFSWKNENHIEVVKHGSIISAIDVTL